LFSQKQQPLALALSGLFFVENKSHEVVRGFYFQERFERIASPISEVLTKVRGLYLNSRYRLIHDEVISVGSLTANIVHPREVFRPALEYSAVAVIIAHNHPSGSVKPTEEDVEITKQLVKAGKILGVDLLDHIIIAKNKFTSIFVNYNQ